MIRCLRIEVELVWLAGNDIGSPTRCLNLMPVPLLNKLIGSMPYDGNVDGKHGYPVGKGVMDVEVLVG